MGNIFIGVAGEGPGVVSEARLLIDTLKVRNHLVVYTSGHTLSKLGPLYREETNVELRALPDLTFPSLFFWPLSVRRLRLDIQRDKPTCVISAGEPLIARAAFQERVAFIPANRVATAPSWTSHLPPTPALWSGNSGLELAL